MDEEDLRPAKIRPLAGEIRHSLCAGQVCVSVGSCVKEMIENSLDAHSTRLQMTFISHGADLIELIDNGDGISEEEFDKIGLRYHTSKLTRFEDLSEVETYGFRGEALSSICIYSDVTIITRHSSSPMGTKFIFNGEGQVISRFPYPREIGTTVSVRALFNRFPVRRKELQAHSKREFAQALNIIQSYAIACRQIQYFQVSASTDNHPPTNSLMTLTPCTSMKDILGQIFGHKVIDSLMHIDDRLLDENDRDFRFDGFISRPQHGCGRSSADRQYLFVNNRPIDCSPILRTINDIYRQFNPNQSPLIALIITVSDRSTLDINCTPDKRTIFLENLSILSEQLRNLLNKLFQASSNVFIGSNKRPQENNDTTDLSTPPIKQMRLDRFAKKASHSSDVPVLTMSNPSPKTSGPFNSIRSEKSTPSSTLSSQERTLFTFAPVSVANQSKPTSKPALQVTEKNKDDDEEDVRERNILRGSPSKKDLLDRVKKLRSEDHKDECESAEDERQPIDHDLPISKPAIQIPKINNDAAKVRVESYRSCEMKVRFNLERLKEKYRANKEVQIKTGLGKSESRFDAHIEADENEKAEEELRRQINKSDFERMSIIGQFNRGFILVTMQDQTLQLFIVDQHAADEIYNFHRLYDQTTISRQPLLHPKSIPLDPSRQILLQQNLDLFNRLGFEIEIDENESRLDRRCRVLTYPTVSGARSCVFGVEEIDEILSHLSETTQHERQEEHYESSRLRKVFASKACRMSIMIGTDLTKKQMTTVVRHLGHLAKPWNCPHGRPTIRHVSNLSDATDGFLADEYHHV